MRGPYIGVMGSSDPVPIITAAEAARVDCSSFVGYLQTNGLDALAAGLQALPHDNARYIKQYQALSLDDREYVATCGRLAAEQLLSDAWSEMTPAEQASHNEWVNVQLAKETAGRPGVSVTCPPGTPPAVCRDKIHAAVDKAECRGGIQIPAGEILGQRLTFCMPRWIVWGGAAAVALLVIGAVRR